MACPRLPVEQSAALAIPYTERKKVTTHSLRAGPNTDTVGAGVPLSERNRRGRRAPGSTTADTAYDRPHRAGKEDPMAEVPIGGHTPPEE
ncbi:hypothetical protein [Streptomyces sp. NPDC005435]|uniref:hypothetical protein n=1 Tax=Streptomyces sp. NPDC005435 TaxID=3154464 RepID=UPI00345699DE